MTTGVWPQVSGDIADSDDAPRHAPAPARRTFGSIRAFLVWALGLTRRGKPPRDKSARLRRQFLAIVVGYGLVGAAIARVLYLLGALGGAG